MMDDVLRLKIEAYLGNEMSDEEKLIFEQDIDRDEELQREVNLQREIILHLKGIYVDKVGNKDSEDNKKLKAFFNSDEGKTIEKSLLEVRNLYKEKTRQPKFKLWRVVAAILVLILAVAGSVNYLTKEPTSLYAKYYNNKDLPSIIKRDAQNQLNEIGTLFIAKEYENCIAKIENFLEKEATNNYEVYLYLAMSYSEINQTDKGIKVLNKLLDKKTLYESKALWFKGLIYLKEEEITKAKETFKELKRKFPKYKTTIIEKLLKEL